MHTQTQEIQAAIVGCNFQLFYREMQEMIDTQVPICVQIHLSFMDSLLGASYKVSEFTKKKVLG
jgi:hypothetical protein